MPKVSKVKKYGLNLKECTSSFAPASQQRIKRLKPTNTRLKQQFEEFWEPKDYKGGRGALAPRPLCGFFSDPKLFRLVLKSRICSWKTTDLIF